MPAGAGQRGPPEDGGDPLRRTQSVDVEGPACPVLHRPLTAEFSIPDRELAVEVPESREGHEVDAVERRRGPQGEGGTGDLLMQGAAAGIRSVFDFPEMPPGLPRELFQREFRELAHGGAW